jgi:hypothetical protein
VIAVQRPHWYSLQLLNESDENFGLDEFLKKYKETNRPSTPKSETIEAFEVSPDDMDLGQLNISKTRHRTCVCSDETMMKHFNLNNP